MAGDEQPYNEISLEGPPPEPTFGYSDLAIEDPDKVKYELRTITETQNNIENEPHKAHQPVTQRGKDTI